MYQPKGAEGEGPATDRSFTSRFGTMKDVSASVDVSGGKFGEAFKSKYAMGLHLGSALNPSQEGTLDTSMHSAKKFSTPSSVKKSDSDYEEQH